jgi:HSP20 family protein
MNALQLGNESFPALMRDLDREPLRVMREMMRWDPFQEMAPALLRERMAFVPAFDVKEATDAYIFTADVPGLREQDIDIRVSGNRVTISGKREQEKREEGQNWYACERSYGQFTRSFTLPEGCKLDDLQANLENGVLMVTVPKAMEVKSRKVAIGGNGKKKIH